MKKKPSKSKTPKRAPKKKEKALFQDEDEDLDEKEPAPEDLENLDEEDDADFGDDLEPSQNDNF